MKKKISANINDEKETIKVKEFLEYKFTDGEIKEFSQELARCTSEKINIENEKAAVMSQYKAKIDTKAADAERLAGQINTGREYRYIDCEIQMNTPKNGRKTLTRLDTAEIVWEKQMTPEEMQLKLNIDADSALVEHSVSDDNNGL